MAEARPAEEGADPTGFRATNCEGVAVLGSSGPPEANMALQQVMFFFIAQEQEGLACSGQCYHTRKTDPT